MIRRNRFTWTWKLLVISPCGVLLPAFETDTHSLIGIVDLLGTSIFVETSTSKKMKILDRWNCVNETFYPTIMKCNPFYLLYNFFPTHEKKSRSLQYSSIDMHYLVFITFSKFNNLKFILNLLFIWPFKVLLLMLNVDGSLSWVFALDVCGGSYVVTSKNVKMIGLATIIRSSKSSHFVLVVKYILHSNMCLTFCRNSNTKHTIRIYIEHLSKLLSLN